MLAYAALPAEIDPSLAIGALRQRGVRIAYTRIEAPGVLGVHVVESETELMPGPLVHPAAAARTRRASRTTRSTR